MSQRPFINPYNFVPLQEEAPYRDKVPKGNLTGVIHFSLRTRTPLIIPNTSNEDAFAIRYFNKRKGIEEKHKSYDFFSYDDLLKRSNLDKTGTRDGKWSEPVIPGSEIRGMLRNYYEILTNSCMSFVDDQEILSKRTSEVFKPGLLERTGKDKFVLHEARDCVVDDKKTTEKLKECQEVFFDTVFSGNLTNAVNVSAGKGAQKHVGYVIKGEKGPKKKMDHCHILMAEHKSGARGRALSKDEIETLDLVLASYNGVSRRLSKQNATKKYRDYSRALYEFKSGRGKRFFPVRYSIAAGNFVMLSPACITREVYRNRLSKLIGKHSSCTEPDHVCPACALFGMLGRKSHVTSRIRVSDMRLTQESFDRFDRRLSALYHDKVTLLPLNSPKINNMEFYLKKPAEDAWFWTYDYYIDAAGGIHSCDPEINGRKFYWHQPEMRAPSEGRQRPSNLNTTFRPLKKGVDFEGEIYFENLTADELDILIYTVNAGDKDPLDKKKHCYKLGHAKPLGYGSVAINVNNVEIRKIAVDDEEGSVHYIIDPYEPAPPKVSSRAIEDLNVITDFYRLKGKSRLIHYPIPDREDNKGRTPIYKWFVDNHGAYDREEESILGMPNSRLQMTYIEHMYSLEPELRETGAPPKYKDS